MPAVPDLDAFDRAIFVLLQKDNAIPQRTIGEVVNLSAPAVQRRIRRMEETSVIRANVALVDPAKVGHPITILVEVEVESERAELVDVAKRSFAAVAEVQQCYYVTGEADFMLVVTVATMADYEALTSRPVLREQQRQAFSNFCRDGPGEGGAGGAGGVRLFI